MSLILGERTKVLRRCFFDVQNEVGLGRKEEGYHRACEIWLKRNGVPFVSRPPQNLRLGSRVAHTLFPDLVAWDAVTVELKAVPRKLVPSEFVQLFDYLKCRGDPVGLLVNMGLDRVHVERLVYQPPRCELKQDWRYWDHRLQGRGREVGVATRNALLQVFREHTTGYGQEVTQKLILSALQQQELRHIMAPQSKAYYRRELVDDCPLDCVIIEDSVLLVHTALFHSNEFNVSRGLSYMKALGIPWGIAANFGRSQAELTALRASASLTIR